MSLSLTLSSLCGRLLLGTKRRFTTGTRIAKLSRYSGDMLHFVLHGSSELYPLLGNSWDRKGLLLTDYLPANTTMNGQYYASLLLKLHDAIKEKRRGMLKQGVWLLHDNAPIRLHRRLFATVAAYSSTTLHTVLTWLSVTIFCFAI